MTWQGLIEGARTLGLELTPAQLAQFETYRRELLDWNARINLTAITDPVEVDRLLFLDSLTCLIALRPRFSQPNSSPSGPAPSLIDVGAGAGFPGLPLKLVWPDVELTLAESVGKKVAFLQHIVERLGLTGVTVIQARAEDLGQDRRYRERFDWAVARAVAPLNVLAEYLLPLVKCGGAMVAPKKGDVSAEIDAAASAIAKLGGDALTVTPVRTPGLTDGRVIVSAPKFRPTPAAFPRRAGLPAKRPLGG